MTVPLSRQGPASIALSLAAVGSAAAIGVMTGLFAIAGPFVRTQTTLFEPASAIIPAVAALCCVVAALAMAARPQLARGSGWVVASAGVLLQLVSTVVTEGSDMPAFGWSWLLAAGIGLTLAGLSRFAAGAGPALRAALAAGLAAGVLAWTFPGLIVVGRLGLLGFATGLIVITTVLAVIRDEGDLSFIDFSLVPATAVAIAAILTMVAVVYRDALIVQLLPPDQWLMLAEAAATGFTVAVGGVLAAFAHRWGGPVPARWVLICLALAGPVALSTTIVFSDEGAAPFEAVVVALSVLAGAVLARRASDYGYGDVLGAVVATAGMVALATVGYQQGITYLVCLMAIAGGAAFALTTGLAGVAARPSGPVGTSLGLAALLLCAQTLGPDVLHDRIGGGAVAPAIALFAILAVVLLIGRSIKPVAALQDDEPVPVSGRTGA